MAPILKFNESSVGSDKIDVNTSKKLNAASQMVQCVAVNHGEKRSAAIDYAKSEWENVMKREHYRMSSDGIPILAMADNTSPIKKLELSLLSFFEQ
jgi:hypothetical protein